MQKTPELQPFIRRLFASRDTHYNKSLNTVVQKQNEN